MRFAPRSTNGIGDMWGWLAGAAALLFFGSAAHATNYNEATQGDLSSVASAPTDIGSLSLGANLISGSTIPSGTFDPNTHSFSNQDNDYLQFTVPTGDVLSTLVVQNGTSIFAGDANNPGDQLFMGIASGSGVSLPDGFASSKGLLGYTLISSGMIGTDILANLGASDPAGFTLPGATKFSGPLGAGTYTLWILDGDRPVDPYKLSLGVSPVPEPASWALMISGFGLIGGALRRTRKTINFVA
jgi:hypothetical protein